MEMDVKSPYMTPQRITKLIRSALLMLYFCKVRKISIPSLFKEGNVGVLEGLDVFVFKYLDIQEIPSEGADENCYKPFLSFFKDLVCKYAGPSALDQLPGNLKSLVSYLEMPVVEDKLVLYHPALFPKHLMATMYLEIHRVLKEQLPARGLFDEANNVMTRIGSEFPDFMDVCSKHSLLKGYSGVHAERLAAITEESKNAYEKMRGQKGKLMNLIKRQRKQQYNLLVLLQQLGKLEGFEMDREGPKSSTDGVKWSAAYAVVDTHRHGIAHAVKTDNCSLIDDLPDANRKSLTEKPYEVDDVVDLFQGMCSEFLNVSLKAMYTEGIWDLLDLETRFPISDIYFQ